MKQIVIALDSNLFIYFLEDNPEFGFLARTVFDTVASNELVAFASELVFYEILAHSKLSKAAVVKLSHNLENLNIDFVSITKTVLIRAAELRRESGLGSFDSIHVASAVTAGATHFVTNDRVLLKKKITGIKLLPLDSVKEASLFPRDINRLAP